jgi:SecD/SecF fusion protein
VACLLAFGGSTLKDFAFALLIGLISSTYSSFGVASPLYVLWKEREPKFAALKKKFDSAASS